MTFNNFSLRLVAVAALLGLSGVAQAALTVYTDEASFMAAVINSGTDDFRNLFDGGGPAVALRRAAEKIVQNTQAQRSA